MSSDERRISPARAKLKAKKAVPVFPNEKRGLMALHHQRLIYDILILVKRSVLILLLVSLLLNGVLVFRSWHSHIVTSVPDGDSLQLADGRRVRLLGIDAPERGRCMSDDARLLLERNALGRRVRLKNIVTDDYGRTLANVIVEDVRGWVGYIRKTYDPYLNRVLVRNGLARFESVNSPYKETLQQSSDFAKEHLLGIYSEVCRKTVPPTGCQLKGNIREGMRVYYPPTCRYYKDVIVDEAFGDQWFCSEKEAAEAGFSFAPSCGR